MKWAVFSVFCIALATALAQTGEPSKAAAQQDHSTQRNPTEKPTTKVFTCTTSGCHSEQTKFEFVHGPTAVGACDACHEYADPAAHTFKVKREGRDLCTFCHIDKATTPGAFVHEPVAKGNCTGCHNPHGSRVRHMLKAESVPAMCTSCHKETMTGSHTHKPAAEDCTKCHQAHSSSHEHLLSMGTRELCLSCHEDVGTSLATMAHPHKPAQEDCLKCHTPHSSNNIRVLNKPVKDLCVSCHEEMKKVVEGASHPHGAVTDERSCANCHSPHASSHVKQLVKDPIATCLSCHDKPIVVNEKKTVPAANEVAVEEFHKHGPINEGKCIECHDIHGGSHDKLLVAPYETSFYQKYSETTYALCFKCHDRALVTTAPTEDKTGFRQGSRNLHAVHVNSTEQGRSCRACHNIHASRHETMIADSVSFGQWNLPLNYKKTPTGGSCAPGCHKPEEYDRGK